VTEEVSVAHTAHEGSNTCLAQTDSVDAVRYTCQESIVGACDTLQQGELGGWKDRKVRKGKMKSYEHQETSKHTTTNILTHTPHTPQQPFTHHHPHSPLLPSHTGMGAKAEPRASLPISAAAMLERVQFYSVSEEPMFLQS
jgi:hypothetical protein